MSLRLVTYRSFPLVETNIILTQWKDNQIIKLTTNILFGKSIIVVPNQPFLNLA